MKSVEQREGRTWRINALAFIRCHGRGWSKCTICNSSTCFLSHKIVSLFYSKSYVNTNSLKSERNQILSLLIIKNYRVFICRLPIIFFHDFCSKKYIINKLFDLRYHAF